jgi:hypothetical protein
MSHHIADNFLQVLILSSFSRFLIALTFRGVYIQNRNIPPPLYLPARGISADVSWEENVKEGREKEEDVNEKKAKNQLKGK